MDFNEYQEKALETLKISEKEHKEPTLLLSRLTNGLCSEAGEFAGKVDKLIRDCNGELNKEFTYAAVKELGDVLWGVALCAWMIGGISLDNVAYTNLKKLEDRDKRNKIHGSGDER